ncbi:MAG: protein kinase [Gemmataceae bacterium]|nr:protein kinase [Gemmataceae bacterium]
MPVETKAPDTQSIGPYDLLSKIAEGGMGTVYRGRNRITGEAVAIKVVPKHLLTNLVFLKRFEQEYTTAKALDHPNIVKALDFGREGETPYLVLEFVEGESLGQRLDRVQRLSERDAIGIISQVAQGLHKAHKAGLIHRDVKPDNILITSDGQVKLTDLGLVKELEADQNLTRTGRGLGTPHYMAPEQFRNAKNADVRCDIYSLAATMYHMVTGELPFKSLSPLDAWMKKIHNELPAPRQILPALSERMDWAIRRSMHSDPNQRAATCREFVEDLTGQSTRRISATSTGGIPIEDLWYMVYKDEDAVIHTVKGSTEGIRRSLTQGLLGDASNIRVSRSKEGPFETLQDRPEFRDIAMELIDLPNQITAKLPTPPPLPRPASTPTSAPVMPMSMPMPTPPSGSVDSFIIPALPSAVPADPAWTPHIPLERTRRTSEWVKWVAMILLAMAAGVAAFFLMPWVLSLRLFW